MAGHPVPRSVAEEISRRLPLFDGYPYLTTRLVPAAYHLTLLPHAWDRDRLITALVRQVEANQFQTALVIGPDEALYLSPGGSIRASTLVPRSNVVLHGLLLPSDRIGEGQLGERRERLMAFAKSVNGDGYLLGDVQKGGHPATRDEVDALRGAGPDGVPRGLTRCARCGEWRGECLDAVPEHPVCVVPVHCLCDNLTRCARCLEPLRKRRLNGNHFDVRDGRVWHWPGFMAGSHRCPPCV